MISKHLRIVDSNATTGLPQEIASEISGNINSEGTDLLAAEYLYKDARKAAIVHSNLERIVGSSLLLMCKAFLGITIRSGG